MAISSGGTIFLANGDDGLRAYEYDGNSFTNTAHIADSGRARRISISPGTIFLANGDDGIRAYEYDRNLLPILRRMVMHRKSLPILTRLYLLPMKLKD